MYAIREANTMAGVGSIYSRDQCTYWWDGNKLTPCSDQAELFDVMEDAENAIAENGLGDAFTVIDFDDDED